MLTAELERLLNLFDLVLSEPEITHFSKNAYMIDFQIKIEKHEDLKRKKKSTTSSRLRSGTMKQADPSAQRLEQK